MENVFLLEKIEVAKKKQKEGKIVEANKIFQDLLKSNSESFVVLFSYGLFCKDLKNFVLAKRVFFSLIKKFPESINSFILLSEILRIENKFLDAERVLLKAFENHPDHADLIYNFSLLYFSMRKFDKAINYINKAIKFSSNNDIYKFLKAEIHIHKYNFDEALNILERLKNKNKYIKDNNRDIRIEILFANIYSRQKRFDEAEKILLKLTKKYKSLEIAYLNLSTLYSDKNQLTKSIKILKEGIKVSPNYMPFYKNLACFYRNSGQIKLAKETNLYIISKNKFDFKSFFELSGIYDFENHQNQLDFLLNTKLDVLNPNAKIYAAFAISNIFHKKRNFKKSADYLKIANSECLKQKQSDYNLKINNAEFYRLLKVENQKFEEPNSTRKMIFIVGMPRSGSTLLENILSLNLEVTDMGEVTFLEESLKEINNIENVFSSYNKKVNHQFKLSSTYTDKNLFNYMYCSIIFNFFPNAKIIHCLRNPLDNILSIYRSNFLHQPFSSSLTDISNLYVHHFKIMQEYKSRYGEIIFDFYYEDLIKNPNFIIQELISWLGWEWDNKYLSPHKNSRNVNTASSAQIRKKFFSSSVGIWKKYQELLAPAIKIIQADEILKTKIF